MLPAEVENRSQRFFLPYSTCSYFEGALIFKSLLLISVLSAQACFVVLLPNYPLKANAVNNFSLLFLDTCQGHYLAFPQSFYSDFDCEW